MDQSTPATQALPAGTRLEQFIIEHVLGSGGFGITYLATDNRLGRKVVIKENLPGQFCFRDPGTLTVAPRHSQGDDVENFRWSLDNFSREAAMLASLDHQGIVRVLHSFEAFGTAYFVMPFVKGETFDEQVSKSHGKPFTEDELRGLLDRVLSALDHIHQRGIYHRDIKPGNILITDEGIPVLIDFGSARQRLCERSMTVVESAGYTPFEQLQSRGNVGPWSDLYSLGATLAKAITGETPPKAADRAFDDPFVPLGTRAELIGRFSPTFLESLDRSLNSRPLDRWQSSNEWKLALRQPTYAKAESPESITATADASASPTPAVWSVHAHSQMPTPAGKERDFLLAFQTSIRMCWIPPGEFLMGSPDDELERHEDETLHQVVIRKGFWIGKYPVTQSQWRAVTGANPSHFIGENLPVESVSWGEICGNPDRSGGFLCQINATAPSGLRFDLPTEAEWEYACRAGTKGPYAGDLDEMGWYDKNSGGKSHPVAQKSSNAWGLHDMHGNVWEWCADWYGSYPHGKVIDPTGSDTASARVRRGGGWLSHPGKCRSAFRGIALESERCNWIGLRLVLRNLMP